MWSHLSSRDVVAARVTDAPAYGRTASGYGAKLPTRYMLALTDGRWHRVYAVSYGNAASLYVVVAGADRYLGAGSESILEAARDGQDVAAAILRAPAYDPDDARPLTAWRTRYGRDLDTGARMLAGNVVGELIVWADESGQRRARTCRFGHLGHPFILADDQPYRVRVILATGELAR